MVQGSLSLGIFLFPDLLGQSSWKVLADDLITMFVALVVLRNFFILQLVGQSAILSNEPLLTNFGDTTALRERVRHFHVRHFRDGEVSHFLSTQSETRILFWASPGWLAGSCSRPQIRLTQHDAGKTSVHVRSLSLATPEQIGHKNRPPMVEANHWAHPLSLYLSAVCLRETSISESIFHQIRAAHRGPRTDSNH